MGRLIWTDAVDRRQLTRSGYEIVEFSDVRRARSVSAHPGGPRRRGLANPAAAWMERVARAQRLAVVGVELEDRHDLAALYGHVLEPVLRARTILLVQSAQRLSRLVPERFVEPPFEYPHTLERALHAAARLVGEDGGGGAPGPASPRGELDSEQRRAVEAHDGVVQVIAPAGSGKTTVLVERARELLRRGHLPERILCTTFNRDARLELARRLRAAGAGAVRAQTIHGIGYRLLRDERLLRSGGIGGELSLAQWTRLCAIAGREHGAWLEPADARVAISTIKLGALATAREYRWTAARDENGPAIARVYELYERELIDRQVNDFDDLVLWAVRALREDDRLRARWQARFGHVLVDEYQDIEPAQELLVRILAAPEDGLFCVGDEDQTLYGWRRASVRRILEFDRAYPGLERIALARNYRCPREVVDASRSLIEHNRVRFAKPIFAGVEQAAGEPGPALTVAAHGDRHGGADAVAGALTGSARAEVVVLARTTGLLREVALACANAGLAIDAPDAVFEPHGARAALEAYLRLCSEPAEARAEDVVLVLRTPSRGLPPGGERIVTAGLRAGRSFAQALSAAAVDGQRRDRLQEAGGLLDSLHRAGDAGRFIERLRREGGLDAHFTDYERTFAVTESVELEALEQAEREARGLSLAGYSAELRRRHERLRAARDPIAGIELTTIHRAKGRQWPHVHLFGCDEGQLPHARALDVDPDARDAGEGIEAERRVAYVALTRAQRALTVHITEATPSRFVAEAGLAPAAGPAVRRPAG